jgi:uncharacterized protein (TIGR02453 family)
MAKKAYFSPKLFKFIRELKTNNNRDWFQANKPRYESDVKEPLLAFIGDVGPHLQKISKSTIADPRPVGGSMFRIYRDVRFSKDKSPYKTQASAWFKHAQGKDVHAPGFYLHLEPGNVFAGAGIWHPDSKTLGEIRDAIVDDPAKWKRMKAGKTFKSLCSLQGDTLIRPPKGYDPDHPLIEDLKRKDFTVLIPLTQKAATSADFLDQFVKACKAASPLNKFLCGAIGLNW